MLIFTSIIVYKIEHPFIILMALKFFLLLDELHISFIFIKKFFTLIFTSYLNILYMIPLSINSLKLFSPDWLALSFVSFFFPSQSYCSQRTSY